MAIPVIREDASAASLFTGKRGAFLLTLVAGALLIIVLKAAVPDRQWVVTLAPVALICAYFAYMIRSGGLAVREDYAADSLYYLGFLYTLVSLSMALYQFHPEESSASHIISNFGIALATTITGLTLRVIALQMGRDVTEIEDDSRLAIANSSFELRKQLDVSVTEFEIFRGKMLAETREVIEAANRGTVALLGELRAEFKATTESLLSDLQGTLGPAMEQGKRLQQSGARVVGGLEKLAERVEGVELPGDIIVKSVREIVDGVAEASAGVRQRVEELAVPLGDGVTRTAAFVRATEEAGTAIERAGAGLAAATTKIAAIEGQVAGIGRLGEEAGALADEVKRARQGMAEHAGALETMAEAYRRDSDRLKATVTDLAGLVDAVRVGLDRARQLPAGVGQLLDTLRDLGSLAERVRALDEALAMHAAAVSELAQQAKADATDIRKRRDEIRADVSGAKDALDELQRAVVSMANLMVERLRDGTRN